MDIIAIWGPRDMLGRILYPILFVVAAVVTVFGVLIYTQPSTEEGMTAEPADSAISSALPARAMAVFQNIGAIFAPGDDDAALATVMIDDIAALDAMADGILPEEEPQVVVPSTPFVRRAGAADTTAEGGMTCSIESGVRRCRVSN